MSMAKYLLRLYPRTWRERYEEEVLAMLEQRSLCFMDGVNLFFGALDAWLHPQLGTASMPHYERIFRLLVTLRRSLLTLFCAYIGFVLAGGGFQKMTEYNDFQEAARTYSIVGLSFHLVVIGAFVALAAVLAGGLPIAVAVVRSALARRRYGPLFGLSVPILAFAVFLLITLFLETIDHPGTQPFWRHFLHQGIFLGVLITAAVTSTGAVCFAVARSEIPGKILRFAVLPSLLATMAMVLVLAATIVWGFGLRANVPQLFAGNDGIVRTSTTGTWLGIVIAMAVATILAMVSLRRGLSARSVLRNAPA
jgi:hypothetical protein